MIRQFTILLLCAYCGWADSILPTFPGADGYARTVTGGRGGSTLFVDNLNESGAGSLKAALQTAGSRFIIVRTNGWLNLTGQLNVFGTNNYHNFTLWGGHAQGDGFGVKGKEFQLWSLTNAAIMHMRFRSGLNTGVDIDTFSVPVGAPITNVIFAHDTFGWGMDENVSVYGENITFQFCINHESNPFDGEVSHADYVNDFSQHNYGGINSGSVSMIYNLWVSVMERAPKLSDRGEAWHNVIYNYKVPGSLFDTEINIGRNYFRPGPSTNIWSGASTNITYGSGLIYLDENHIDGFAAQTADNSLLLDTSSNTLTNTPWSNSGYDYTRLTALEAMPIVTNYAGAIRPTRDDVDIRLISEFNAYTASGDNGNFTNGFASAFPTLDAGSAITDTDSDGMEDSWETTYFGDLSRTGDTDSDDDGYTDLEEFLYSDQYCLWLDTDLDGGSDSGDFLDMQPNRWEEWTIDEDTGPSATYGLPLSGSGGGDVDSVTLDVLIIGG